MKQFLDNHFDIMVLASITVLLIGSYVILLAGYGIDNEALKTLTIGAVGGVLGMGTKKTRGDVNVEGDVNVKEPRA